MELRISRRLSLVSQGPMKCQDSALCQDSVRKLEQKGKVRFPRVQWSRARLAGNEIPPLRKQCEASDPMII